VNSTIDIRNKGSADMGKLVAYIDAERIYRFREGLATKEVLLTSDQMVLLKGPASSRRERWDLLTFTVKEALDG